MACVIRKAFFLIACFPDIDGLNIAVARSSNAQFITGRAFVIEFVIIPKFFIC